MGVNDKFGIDFANYSDDNIKKIFHVIKEKNPSWICGSPSTLYGYAQKINTNVVAPIESVKFIELQGEYCDSFTRKFIESKFECKTIIHYGNRECWAIAYECPHGKLHIMPNILIENAFDANGQNHLILTSLTNKKMPFLRYMTNDLGMVINENCKCGKDGEVVYLEGGRRANVISGKDLVGDIVFKKIIHNIINKQRSDLDIIRQYRVQQTGEDEFIYYIDKGCDFIDSYLEEIKDETRHSLGASVVVKFSDYLEPIGKYRVFEPLN